MRPAIATSAAMALLLLTALVTACGGDDGGDAGDDQTLVSAAAFGARLLTVGEPIGTVVDSRVGELVPGLQLALNPDIVVTINGAVDEADQRLTTIAETAGMTPEDFAAAWETDRAAAFASFVDGLEELEDADAVRDDLFIDQIAELPVHPAAVLLGSGRIERPGGETAFFLVYDVADSPVAVEEAVSRLLDRTPWQVTYGQSSEDISLLQFQNTTSADIEGVAWVMPLAAGTVGSPVPSPDEGDGDSTAAAEADGYQGTIVYLIEVQPLEQSDEEPFVLPDEDRPVPEGFPASFLLGGEQTVFESLWNTVPGGSAYQLTLLTRASAFDVADIYRDRLDAEGWDLTGDDAVGFATVLTFTSQDGDVQGTASFDSFEQDDDYTQIVLQVQAVTPASN